MIAPRLPRRSRVRAAPGFILVAVLWILAALAAFTAVYAVYVSDTASAAAVRADTLRADALAVAAVELAALRLLSVPPQERPVSGEVRFRMGDANVSARFVDEAARIDLNAAAPEVLAGLFEVLGVPEPAAKSYGARIFAWRKPADTGGRAAPAAESAGDEAATDGASAPDDETAATGNGAFAHVAELVRVPGLPADLVAAALPYLTVYAGRREVNPELAGPVVRAALAKAGQAVGDADDASSGPGEGGGDGSLVAATSSVTSVAGDTARITVRITFDNGRRHGREAVLLLRDFGTDPYRVLMWREPGWREMAEGTAPPAPRHRAATGGRP